MHIKSLELYGFKSFANKAELIFEKGITAIVGPNGSGKSNISDAIRWVLGEQSVKVLRGHKMEDVIFAGSNSRHSLGFAEVSLVLDNAQGALPIDYEEVMITRRLYRSGESVYLLNKNKCRLKDITELFWDTGVGKEGYSIIEQGRIDSILSVKPEDRRSLFEEAAGIVRYKSKKGEATDKLKSTEDKMVRIKDILSEIKGRLEPLRKQAERAREYMEVRDELKNAEILYYGHKLLTIDSKNKSLGEQKENKQKQSISTENEISSLDARIEEDKLKIMSIESKLDSLMNDYNECIRKYERSEDRIDSLADRIESIDEQVARAQVEKNQVDQGLQRQKTEKIKIQEESIQLESDINHREQQLNKDLHKATELRNELEYHEGEIKSSKERIIDILSEQSRHKNEIASIDAEVKNDKMQAKRFQKEIDNKNNNLKELNDRLLEYKRVKESVDDEKEKLSNDIKRSLESKEVLNKKLQSTSKAMEDAFNQINTDTSRLKALEDMEAQYEGYFKGVKEIMKAKDMMNDLKGVLQVVAGVLKVKEGFETAMEVALGNRVQNVICQSDYDAEKAIKYLKEKKLGRVTLLPLNIIVAKEMSGGEKNILKKKGIIGQAKEYASYENMYEPAIGYLLGRTVIAEDLKSARTAIKEVKANLTVVTIEGDIITPGGAITGGSRNERGSQLLWRQKVIRDLKGTIQKEKERLNKIKEDKERIQKRINGIQQACEENEQRLKNIELEQAKRQQEISNVEDKRGELLEEISLIEFEIEEISSKHDEILQNRKVMEKALKPLVKEDEQIRKNIKNYEDKLEALTSEERELLENITEKKVFVGKLQQGLEDKKSSLESVQDSVSEYEQRLESINKNINDLKDKKENCKAEMALTKENMETLLKQKKDLFASIERDKEQKKAIEEQEQIVSKKKSELEKELDKHKEELYDIQLSLSKLDMEITSIIEHVQVEYDMDKPELMSEYSMRDNDSLPSMKHIKELNYTIRNFGNVNLGAIEEYDEIRERNDFLSTQLEDLTSARESLLQVIKEIDNTIKRQFLDTFERVKEGFQHTFTRLFGGGNAQLFLTDKEDVSQTGIRIQAQPPGKRLQNLLLLSGGERTLTAIALLFAIMQVKPSPFCVLDEIDAALDDSNVTRFVNLLNEYFSKTQLIIVTHRKATMEAANSIYGVTMEETGASRMVSLRIEDTKKYVES